MHDVARFQRQFLHPCLEFLCSWWDWVKDESHASPVTWAQSGPCGYHWRHPYGVYNPINAGNWGEYDSYLESGSTAGLQKVKDLFPELT
jgi:hypothetical protein